MKKFLYCLLLSVITIGASAVFQSCNSSDDDSNSLVGTKWECAEDYNLYTFHFTSETICRLKQQERHLDYNFDWVNVTTYIQYRYTLNGNVVYMTPIEDDGFMVPLKAIIKGNTMTVINTDTNKVIYTCTKVK